LFFIYREKGKNFGLDYGKNYFCNFELFWYSLGFIFKFSKRIGKKLLLFT